MHFFSKVNFLKQKLQADNRNFSRAYHCEVFGRAVLPTEVAALQHLFQLVTRPVEDVLHVRRWILQIGGLVAVLVFGRQAGQVGQVVDVGVGKCRKAETVDVADGHGGEHHLRGGLLVQRRDVRMLQVGDGTLCRMVQKESQGHQECESPEGLSDAQPARHKDVVNPMERAGIGKAGQVLDWGAAALFDKALLVPILVAFLFLILLCKFDFANKFDRHVGSQVCVWDAWITAWSPSIH